MSTSIAARFERIADVHRDRLALHTPERTLNYQQFNAEANRIAHAVGHLVPGIPAGRIALLFEQGEGGILSIFGTLKTGHAFVPLDAADGSDRMRNILADCQPVAILTDSGHLAAAESLNDGGVPIVCVDNLPADLPTSNPNIPVDEDADAYVFYTSGSTGNPKGVRQSQRNLQHFVAVYSRTLELGAEDRLTLFYSLAFSASNMDVFGALLSGAALFPYDIRKQGTAALGDWLDRHAITILHAVPTVYRHLTRQLPAGRILGSIRGVDLGGEAVYATDVELHRSHFREGCVLINHLAATEASVIAQQVIDPLTVAGGEMLPVGPPSDGMEIHVLDSGGSPVEAGGTGEIVLVSRYISPGYWQQPELDARAFGLDAARPGWRTYRSGDLGYFSENGNLHFLGRKDHRVKVRGHTVDTSEIESAIRATMGVRDVAVVLQEETGSAESGRLVAFLAGDTGLDGSLDQLRLSLRALLPSYMIPAAFMVLESLPTTASGKLDRKALVALEVRESREGKNNETPVGGTEQAVAEVFSVLLKVERPGREEDFFLSGGDSLKATLLHAQLEDRFNKSIPLEKLFAAPTVRGIAALIEGTEVAQRQIPPVIVPLRETGKNVPFFLTHGARGQAFVSPHFLSILGENQPVYALQATGLKPSALASIKEMAAEYNKALRDVQPTGPYFLGALCIGSLLAIEMARQLKDAGETVGPLVLIDPPPNPPADRSTYERLKELSIAHYKKFLSRFGVDKEFLRQVRKRAGQGRVLLDTSDPHALKAVQRVALDFKLALLNYRLPFYDGPVLIMGTTSRLGKPGTAGASVLMRKLTGDTQIFNVGPKHGEIHDVGNELFAQQMGRVIEIVEDYFSTRE